MTPLSMRSIHPRLLWLLAMACVAAATIVALPTCVCAEQVLPELIPPESALSRPAEDGQLQEGENVDWEEMRVDWEDLEDQPTPDDFIEPESMRDDWPSASMVWVLGHEDGIGWFGLENSGILGYWGPTGFHSEVGYSILFLEGPQKADLNPRMFGLNIGAQYRADISGPWSYELAIAPGVYTDFEDSVREGIRVQGHGMAMWTEGGLQLVLGIDYLDRKNLPLLPIAGFVWEVDDFTRMELVFPKPRISRLVKRHLESDLWVYVSADYGGYSWAVERDSGLADVATLNEMCLLFGTEYWNQAGRSTQYEVGWHFNRDLEFSSGLGSFRPKNTFSIRFGSRF